MKRHFGWKRQLPDARDFSFFQLSGVSKQVELPSLVDLRGHCPDPYDQGQLGSCTANAIAFVCEFDLMGQKPAKQYVPSRLFIYYNERVLEGTTSYDSGASLRDGIKSINQWGFAHETLWPYVIPHFKTKPPMKVYAQAAKEKVPVQDYGAVPQNLNDMKTALVQGYPIVLGFTVYSSFMSAEVAQTGIVPMPKAGEAVEGGHAVAIVGYDDSKHCFIVRNSWGQGWGDKGYFYMPYDYFVNPSLASDLWVVRLVPVV